MTRSLSFLQMFLFIYLFTFFQNIVARYPYRLGTYKYSSYLDKNMHGKHTKTKFLVIKFHKLHYPLKSNITLNTKLLFK